MTDGAATGRPAKPDVPALVASGLAFALLSYHVVVLFLNAPTEVRDDAPGVLAFQAIVVGLLVAAAVARRARWRAGLYVLGGLGALLYGVLTWPILGVVDVVAALAAGYGFAVSVLRSSSLV